MKLIKILFLTIFGILLVLLAISFALPNSVKVERSLSIKTKPKNAFNLVNNLLEWKNWSPWYKLDTNAVWTYGPIESGVGAKYSWKSNDPEVGTGELIIEESLPDSFIKASMQFGEMDKSTIQFRFNTTDEGIKITWQMESNIEHLPFYRQPFARYFYLLMDEMIGSDFEKGLKNMQVILESQKTIMVGDFEAEIRDFKGLNYVGIREKIKGEDISTKLGEHYASLQLYLQTQNSIITGAPFTINYSAKGDLYDMTAALPTESLHAPNPPMLSGIIKPSKWLVVNYYGDYNNMSPVYQKGFEYLAENNLKPSGAPMEFYITDPMMEKDTALWLTELVFPYIE